MIPDNERLIIVTGLAHSGTTILTHTLAQHPDVVLATNGTEVWLLENDWLPNEDSDAIAKLLADNPGKRVLLKRPWNVLNHSDWMLRDMPHAFFIDCWRNFEAISESWSKPTSLIADDLRNNHERQKEVYVAGWHAASEFKRRIENDVFCKYVFCAHEILCHNPESEIKRISTLLGLKPFEFDVSAIGTTNIKHGLIPEIADGRYTLGTRGNGFQWAVDPKVPHSGLDLRNHEDWIYPYLETPADGVFVDVGAFVGTHAIRVAKQCGCRVIAFEPVEAHRNVFAVNQMLNETGVDVRVKAVGDFDGVIGFRADGPAESGVPRNPDRVNTTVEITTLDRSLKTLDRLDVLLIDVEGFEVKVLAGACDVVRRCRPRVIIEVHSHYGGCEHNGNMINEWCDANGYRSRRIWENSKAYYYVELTPCP